MTGYSLSFIAGSSGRFLSNITYSLLNNLKEDIDYCEVNSAHNTNLFKSNIDLSTIPDINFRAKIHHLRLFRYLHFLPTEYVPVLPTHSYPISQDLDLNPYSNTFKMIVIGIKEDDLIEINTNYVLKNLHRIINNYIRNGCQDSIEDIYLQETLKLLAEFKINFLSLHKKEVIEKFARLHSIKQLKSSYIGFIEPKINPKYVDKTLVIYYNELFEKTNTGYKGLDMLCEWLNVSPSNEVINNYTRYVSGRESLLQKFEFLTKRRKLCMTVC